MALGSESSQNQELGDKNVAQNPFYRILAMRENLLVQTRVFFRRRSASSPIPKSQPEPGSGTIEARA